MSEPEFEGVLPDLEGLDDEQLRALIERAALINEMVGMEGWTAFVDYLVALTVAAQNRILGGYCRSMEEYRHETGRVAGIREALQAPDKLNDQLQRIREQAYEGSGNGGQPEVGYDADGR